MTLDGELGKALFQACIHSTVDDVLVIACAARRIRKVSFCDNKTFDGDISLECQESSVPTLLIRLISLILVGGKPEKVLTSSQSKIACNISQIIKFNAVKKTRKKLYRTSDIPGTMSHLRQLPSVFKSIPRQGIRR